jgi:iron complex outermembrane recepter protein
MPATRPQGNRAYRPGASACLAAVLLCPFSRAQTAADTFTGVERATLVVESAAIGAALGNDFVLDGDALAARRLNSSDTASMLPGVTSAQSGGVSGLPLIRGLGDDRVRILVNGVPVAAACALHMNPPLSYIDPANVARIDVLPGVTPVSLGGDSIGGTILVESATPVFAASNSAIYHNGSVSSFYRSNGDAVGVAAAGAVASSDFALRYDGSASRAGDYRDGGETIRASRYESTNQQITAAYRSGESLYELQASLQHIPYEEFPNADMDMSGNIGEFISARYRGGYSWGEVHVSGFYDRIRHEMNGNAADRYPPSPVDITSMGFMPMHTRAQDFGYRVKADIAATQRDTLRIGNELHVQTLDDRWPGAPVGMMFDYVNVNSATRTQLGTFAEWARRWSGRWTTLLGARNDRLWMDTGPVQGYDGLDATARAFNATERSSTDSNFDATLLSRYQPDDQQTYGLGLARKNRSPNFYERYAWGTNTMGMVTWFGDGNGYTGNSNLKPETAYTASISGDWHDRGGLWEAKVTPYYTAVQDYIGVAAICGPACSGMPASQLMFVNHRARLYGVDVTETLALANGTAAGSLRLTGSGGFSRGQDLSARTGLYHMLPPNGTIAVEHQLRRWSSALEMHAVSRKTEVDATRLEPRTPGYAILNLRSAYEWRSVRLDLAATNLLDRQYQNPLGGTWQSALYPPGFAGAAFRALPAPGRSLDAGVTVKF